MGAHEATPTRVIRVVRGQTRGHRLEWRGSDPLTLGRDPANQLVLPDEHVSGFHGERRINPRGQVVFVDLGSTNGSALVTNGQTRPAQPHVPVTVTDDDRLLLGDLDTPVVLRLYTDLSAEDNAERGFIVAQTHIRGLDDLEGRVGSNPDVLRQLYDIVKRLSHGLDLPTTLEQGAQSLFEMLPPATHVTMMLESESAAEVSGETRYIPAYSRRRDGVTEAPRPVSRWLRGRLQETRSALLIADAAEEVDSSHSLQRALIDSMIAVPLTIDDRIFGIVQIDRRGSADQLGHARPFSQDDLERAVVIASPIGLAINNARLYRRLAEAEEKLRGENTFLKRRDAAPALTMIGSSNPMRNVLQLIDKVCDTTVPVCVIGETGTGKELVARAIHYRSKRSEHLFVAQNCAALPEDLLESELFGHKKGAFTGADSDKKGLFEYANKGTIFLDEIGETSPSLQAKLLRVLQEGEIRPVGALTTRKVDVRVISATNRDLEEEVAAGRFREDLFYRLNVFPIQLPPLRDRKDDIPELIAHFMERFAIEMDRAPVELSPSTLDLMVSYKWPGNIRELQNEVQRLLICGAPGAVLEPKDLSARIRRIEQLLKSTGDDAHGSLKERLRNVERYILIEALRDHNNNKTRTAETLGITREGLHKKLARFGIT